MAATLYDWGNLCHENVREIMLLNGKREGKYRQVIYCCYLTVAESAGTPQLILNLKRHFYPFRTYWRTHKSDYRLGNHRSDHAVYKAEFKVRQQLTLQSLIIDFQCRRQCLDLSKPNTLTGQDQLIVVITTS